MQFNVELLLGVNGHAGGSEQIQRHGPVGPPLEGVDNRPAVAVLHVLFVHTLWVFAQVLAELIVFYLYVKLEICE